MRSSVSVLPISLLYRSVFDTQKSQGNRYLQTKNTGHMTVFHLGRYQTCQCYGEIMLAIRKISNNYSRVFKRIERRKKLF